MENETQEQEVAQAEQKSVLHQVTPLSKYLAMALFVILPFVGGYIGYMYAPEKMVEVEREVVREVEIDKTVEVPIQSVEETSLSQDESVDLESEIFVVDYKLDSPAFIEIGYKDMPPKAGGLALCVPEGGCTDWVDGTFSPTSNEGAHTMLLLPSTKGIGAGEYVIVVVGDSFTDQLFVSDVFSLE